MYYQSNFRPIRNLIIIVLLILSIAQNVRYYREMQAYSEFTKETTDKVNQFMISEFKGAQDELKNKGAATHGNEKNSDPQLLLNDVELQLIEKAVRNMDTSTFTESEKIMQELILLKLDNTK